MGIEVRQNLEAKRYYRNGKIFWTRFLPNAPNLFFRFKGALNLTALTKSVTEVIERQRILDTAIELGDGVVTYKANQAQMFKLELIDCRNLHSDDIDKKLEEVASSMVWRPFDFGRDSPVRMFVLTVSDLDFVIGVVIHHAFADAVGAAVFIDELSNIYSHHVYDEPLSLDAPSLQYIDHLQSLEDWLQADEGKAELSFWSGRLSNVQPVRMPILSGTETGVANKLGQLDAAACAAVVEFGRTEKISIFLLYLAAHYAALWATTGCDDLTLRIVHSGRENPKVARLIASLAGVVPCRVNVSGTMTFRTLLGAVRDAWRQSRAHMSVPYDVLMTEFGNAAALEALPLFNFVDINAPALAQAAPNNEDLNAFRFAISQRGFFPLRLDRADNDLWDGAIRPYSFKVVHGQPTWFEMLYSSDVCRTETAHSFVDTFTRVISRAPQRPDQDLRALAGS